MYTELEKAEVIRRVDEVRSALLAAVDGLSEAQLKFKPSTDAWSVSEIVEHVSIVEDRILGRISDLLASATPSPSAMGADPDGAVFNKTIDRSRKATAPEFTLPKGQPLSNSLERLNKTRQRILDLVQSAPSHFRQYAVPHPRLGPLDNHQWLIMLAGHCCRHTEQILETKSAPEFPLR
jgi:uncharacterized damage-inducible protein DinB